MLRSFGPFRFKKKLSPEQRRLQSILREADAARDLGDWALAARGYSDYVEARPDAAGIWVQLGNMLKESALYDAAREAYEKAFALEPDNADTALMAGHLMKKMRDYDAAETFYRRALELAPDSRDAFRELGALGVFPAPTGSARMPDAAASLLIDLSDVFKFLKDHATVSGIQRVQLAMTENLLRTGHAGLKVSYLDEGSRAYYLVDTSLILELCDVLRGHGADHGRLKALLQTAETSAEPYRPVAGDTVFVAGAFWMLPDAHGIYAGLKQRGVHIGVYIYDIIPITHPEFCAPALVANFTRCLFHFLTLADFIFTISDYSGEELVRVFQDRVPQLAPVSTARLAHEMPAAPDRKHASDAVNALLDTPYVLFVSTLEARKNHMYLFRAWQRLMKKHPAEDLPDLVFVGRPGWRIDDTLEAFEDTGFLSGKLRIMNGISDSDLALLYSHARFTVFPSHAEGWGLPIGESLAFGTPCVASNSTSMPEVAGDFVDYIDPDNIAAGTDLFETLIFEEGALAERRDRIAKEFKAVLWRDVAQDLLNNMTAHIARLNETGPLPGPGAAAVLPAGLGYGFENSLAITDLDAIQALAAADFAFDETWYWDDHQIKWLVGRSARFNVRCREAGADEEPAESARYIPFQLDIVRTKDASASFEIEFHNGSVFLGRFRLTSGQSSVYLTVPLDPETGVASFEMRLTGEVPRDSRLRPVGIGVSSLSTGSPVREASFSHFNRIKADAGALKKS
ncbi:glycosyltransferase involved in cell wall biosynthesis [Roseibium hamelinense]|uniref:Glycosyltransferase involved in cell wall biosynthesis n=1 Tax=Roseibium hamelinense TaxID=150831 RepID=A0A562T1B0_9HYPH|nr:glycosyltransferase family 1 protein [Roseibium hamelinense]MTI44445.1 glycosyltransferase [Roseibium hamelinense]TWI87411.1 glycosyltransferase involved in cell wall biosynthesis [Roseibium hamelinense]